VPDLLPRMEYQDYLFTARSQLKHMLTLSPLQQHSTRRSEAPSLPPQPLLVLPLCPRLVEHKEESPSERKATLVGRTISMRHAPDKGTNRSILQVPSLPLRPEKKVEELPKEVPKQQIRSILRRSRTYPSVSSVESDIPSLASSSLSLSSLCDEDKQHKLSPHRRHTLSEPMLTSSKRISFDPRIWVREFERSRDERESIWYTNSEMCAFKQQALQCILAYTKLMSYTELIPTGTGRTMIRRRVVPPCKALFSHKALQHDSPIEVVVVEGERILCVDNTEVIRNILLVDPHQICLELFSKAFQRALPGVTITTACSEQEALKHAAAQQFDIILVEERLGKGSSGAMLLQRLAFNNSAVLIGVSAHLDQDAVQLKLHADLVWAKPPPPVDASLLNMLRPLLLAKRRRQAAR
jgi:CheY-like chemotaxis protein